MATSTSDTSKYHQAAVLVLGDVAVGTISLYVDQFSEAALQKLSGAGISVLLDDVKLETPKAQQPKVLVTSKYG